MLHESFSSFFKKQLVLEKNIYDYIPPKNKRMKMFDFYVLTYIKDVAKDPELYSARGRVMRFPEDLKISAEQASDTIVQSLEKDFLRDVLYSICSEMRHHNIKTPLLKDVQFVKVNLEGEEGVERIFPLTELVYKQSKEQPGTVDIENFDGEIIKGVKPFKPFGTESTLKRAAWVKSCYAGIGGIGVQDEDGFSESKFEAVLKRVDPQFDGKNFNTSRIRMFVNLVADLFLDTNAFFGQSWGKIGENEDGEEGGGEYEEGYAGRPWSDIAHGWLRLAEANTLQEKAVAVDHIYDLQHNNGSVFTKLREYEMGGSFEWLSDALDIKRDIKDYYQLLLMRFDKDAGVSSAAKGIALKVLHLVKGTSEQEKSSQFSKEQVPDKEIEKYVNAEPVKPDLSFRWPELQQKDLTISNPKIKTLPSDLVVTGSLSVNGCSSLEEYPAGIKVGKHLIFTSCLELKKLPRGLKVNGTLRLFQCIKLPSLPENLEVERTLDIQHCYELAHVPTNIKADYLTVWCPAKQPFPFIKKYYEQANGDMKAAAELFKKDYPGVGAVDFYEFKS